MLARLLAALHCSILIAQQVLLAWLSAACKCTSLPRTFWFAVVDAQNACNRTQLLLLCRLSAAAMTQ
jgi:hypothetical protein